MDCITLHNMIIGQAAKALSSQSLKPAKTRRNQSWKPVETLPEESELKPVETLPEESELKPVETLPEESESGTCQKFKEPESGACQKSMEPHSGAEICTGKDTTHLCLWKALFSSLFGWWDNKKNRSYPISGYALWLGPNEPPWIKRKVQLLDWKMGEHCEEERHKNLYLWQGFFTSHHEWWDYRNNKKNSRSPDFKHRDTGEALWLNPNYPPRVNLQIQFA